MIGIETFLVSKRHKNWGEGLWSAPSEVRMQIILESVFLTVIAGIFGIVLGAFVLARDQRRYSKSGRFSLYEPYCPYFFCSRSISDHGHFRDPYWFNHNERLVLNLQGIKRRIKIKDAA